MRESQSAMDCADGGDQRRSVDEELVSLFRALADDDQDSVRLQTVENCCALAKALPNAQQRRCVVLPVLLSTASDRSWRVRWSASSGRVDIYTLLCEGEEGLIPPFF